MSSSNNNNNETAEDVYGKSMYAGFWRNNDNESEKVKREIIVLRCARRALHLALTDTTRKEEKEEEEGEEKKKKKELLVNEATVFAIDAQLKKLHAQLNKLTEAGMLLVELCNSDPENQLFIDATHLPLTLAAARIAGPERIKVLPQIAKEIREDCERVYKEYGDEMHFEAALKSLQTSAVKSLLESEAEATSYFAQIEPYVASVLQERSIKDAKASAIAPQLDAGGDA